MYDGSETVEGERRGVDRRRRRVYVFRDKRTGFDRRCQPREGLRGLLWAALVALRDNPRALRVTLLVVNALNLIDFGLTLNALSIGAVEANPIMASLLEVSPIWAGIFKTAAVLVATAIVWEWRRYRKALAAALVMIAVFAGVFIYHIVGLALLG